MPEKSLAHTRRVGCGAAIMRESDIKIEPKEDEEPQTMRVFRVNLAEMFNAYLKDNK